MLNRHSQRRKKEIRLAHKAQLFARQCWQWFGKILSKQFKSFQDIVIAMPLKRISRFSSRLYWWCCYAQQGCAIWECISLQIENILILHLWFKVFPRKLKIYKLNFSATLVYTFFHQTRSFSWKRAINKSHYGAKHVNSCWSNFCLPKGQPCVTFECEHHVDPLNHTED